MLTKNIYLIYPAGYSGSYVDWAISISDADLSLSTIKDPINKDKSSKFGGVGTSHLHQRIPTHQGYFEHLSWVLYNQPKHPLIYLINPVHKEYGTSVSNIISRIIVDDPTGIFISINDTGDDMRSYGIINAATKWPTNVLLAKNNKFFKDKQSEVDFDPFSSTPNILYRNWVVKYQEWFAPTDSVNYDEIDSALTRKRNWFNTRSTHQPHEVNKQYYNSVFDRTNRIFEFDCVTVASKQFPNVLENILNITQASDNFDCSYLKSFHQQYIDIQPNLQWFDSIKQWEETGELDSYLQSHSIIEAELIRKMFRKSGPIDGWENMTIAEINKVWCQLPGSNRVPRFFRPPL